MKLRFEVHKKLSQKANHPNSVKTPSSFPCFMLVFNDDWNDYSYRTWFALWYFGKGGSKKLIGELKILNTESSNTFDEIPKSFDSPLSDKFCSLGITSDYYSKLRIILKDDDLIHEVLSYLNDIAWNMSIREKFEKCSGYDFSLTRDYSSQKALKEARFLLNGVDKNNAFSFEYIFHPPYNESLNGKWKVDIPYNPRFFARIYALIGENGVGKTSLLNSFVKSMVSVGKGGFKHKPLFNALNVISSVSSDGYEKDTIRATMPYACYDLDQNYANHDTIIGAVLRISNSQATINNESPLLIYKHFMEVLLQERAEGLFYTKEYEDSVTHERLEKLSIRDDVLREQLKILSSGHLHLLAMVTYLVANLRLSSLVILDEPEIHLHPSAIISFMAFLAMILDKFNSYAIIATHSPLIVREIINDNVYQFIRVEKDNPLIAKVSFDTFGEDISVLYSKIFGYDDKNSIFSRVVANLADKGHSVSNIETIMKSAMPMNLNARLRINDITRRIAKNNA